MASKNVYRPTMSSDDIFELVDILEQNKRTVGLSGNMRKLLSKLDSLAYDIGKGNRTPSYTTSGIRESQKVTIDNLNGMVDAISSKGTVVNLGVTITPEQKEEAELAAGMHLIVTGQHKDWKEFLNVPTVTNDLSLDDNSPSDSDLFKSL